jgi:hypothetical protein
LVIGASSTLEIMAGKNTDWSRGEHSLAFNLYCKIPFGQIHRHNPRVIPLVQFTPALPARGDVAQASRRQGLNHAPGRCMNPPPGRLRHGGGCAQALNLRNGLCPARRATRLPIATGRREL